MEPEWYAKMDGSYHRIFGINVDKSFDKPDIATFTTVYSGIAKNKVVELYVKQLGMDNRIYIGIITSIDSVNKGSTFRIGLQELSTQLYNVYIKYTDKRGFFRPKIQIRNPDQDGYKMKVSEYINRILKYDTPNKTVTSANLAPKNDTKLNGTNIPYTTTQLPNFPLSFMTVGTALDKFIKDICGLHYWFDYTNNSDSNRDTFPLLFGSERDIRTIDADPSSSNYMLITSNGLIGSQALYPISWVILTSRNTDVYGIAGNKSGKYGVVYKIDGNFAQKELVAIATRILRDRQNEALSSKYKVTFPLTSMATWNAGDVFSGLGDSTIDPVMPYRKNTDTNKWQIFDMNISDGSIEVVVGGTYISVFDVYRDRLQVVDGADLPTVIDELKLGADTS